MRINWTDNERYQIVKELYRRNPSDVLLNSELFTVTKAQFVEAQEVLHPSRRRAPQMSIERPRLKDAVYKLKQELKAEAERKAQEQAQEQAALQAIPLPPPPNPYELALAPLVNMIANQLAEITRNDMRALLAAINAKASTVEFSNLPDPTGQTRPKIAVVGPLPVQQQDIAKAFPQVDFVFVEKSSQAFTDRFNTCEFIIGMVDFFNHSDSARIKNKYPDKWKPVNGNVSGVKRLIGILLHSQGHKPQEPQGNPKLH